MIEVLIHYFVNDPWIPSSPVGLTSTAASIERIDESSDNIPYT